MLSLRSALKAVQSPVAPRTPAVHLQVGPSALGFTSDDPKASRTLKSTCAGLAWQLIWFYTLFSDGVRVGQHSRPEWLAEKGFWSGLA